MVGRRLAGKVAVVTGGNVGLGLATAKAMAAEGARLVLAARNAETGEAAAAAIRDAGGEAVFVQADVISSADMKRMVEVCLKTYGRLDIAYNNAGITGAPQAVAETDEDLFDQVMAVNVRGVFLAMKHEVPAMLEAGGGSIINCSSVAGLRGAPGNSAYYASKHAVIGLTRSAALDYAKQGIRVNAICPGLTLGEQVERTFASAPERLEMFQAKIPAGRAGQPQDVAQAVVWLASDESQYITGTALPIDGGASV